MPAYLALVGLAAPSLLVLTWWVHRPGLAELPGLLVLLALGAASARLRDVEGEAQIDLSFTAAILLAAIPMSGPFGAAILGALIPLLDVRPVPTVARLFNSAMTCLVGGLSGLSYLAFGGWVPVPAGADGRELLMHVAVPLVGADIVLCLINAALVGVMIWLHEEPGWRLLLEPFLATLPVYLGYALTAFLFVVLWEQVGLGALAAAFIVAPLLLARWAYVQYIAESRSRQRIIDALAAAGHSPAGAERRARRIEAILRIFEPGLELSRRAANAVRYGALLHDIGMVAIPRETDRRQAGELTAADLRILRSHPVTGQQVLHDIGFLRDAAAAVRHHHERWDGTGYPDGLAGPAIPLPARVLAIVDAFEARAWRDSGPTRPVQWQAALDELRRRSGSDFDPALVQTFERLITDSPDGSLDVPDRADPQAQEPATAPLRARRGAGKRLRHADPLVGDAIALAQQRGILPPAGRHADQAPPAPTRVPAAISGRWLFAWLGLLFLGVLFVESDRAAFPAPEHATLIIFFATLVLTERFRIQLLWRLPTAPTAAAAGIAFAMTTGLPDHDALGIATWQIVGVVVAAQLLDWFTARRHGSPTERREAAADAVIRTGSVTIVSVLVRDVPWPGGPLAQQLLGWPQWLQAILLTIIVCLVLLAESPARVWARSRGERLAWARETTAEISVGAGLGIAIAATAVVLAMAERVLGLAAIPLLLVPLSVSQLAFGRYLQTRHTYRQIVRALSRLPELAGRVPAGHAEAVAAVAVGIGVRLGLRERELAALESAAMLHDTGQLGLTRPLPRGATVLAAPSDQEHIARQGARIVDYTGTFSDVADIVRHQAVPYHRVIGARIGLPLGARIVKVANAYVDYLGEEARDPAQAIERLYLGLGHEFDPRVVRACEALMLEGEQAWGSPAAVPSADRVLRGSRLSAGIPVRPTQVRTP